MITSGGDQIIQHNHGISQEGGNHFSDRCRKNFSDRGRKEAIKIVDKTVNQKLNLFLSSKTVRTVVLFAKNQHMYLPV